MAAAWVLGAGGLLGSALCRTLCHAGVELFRPGRPLRWNSAAELEIGFAEAVREFSLLAQQAGGWEIYWAAGIGTMGSQREELLRETRTLELFLKLMGAVQDAHPDLSGTFAFASSAGAIYAGCTDFVITEQSAPAPTTNYGKAKIDQEQLIHDLLGGRPHVSVMIARVSTIYGPGQSTGKSQGLLAHIARSVIRNRPIQIYVPLDTARDYISSADAAARIVSAVRSVHGKNVVAMHIVASEQPVTIAEVIWIFRRVAHRNPLIVTSANHLSRLYARCVRYRSILDPAAQHAQCDSLLIGISQLMAAERRAYAKPADRHGLD